MRRLSIGCAGGLIGLLAVTPALGAGGDIGWQEQHDLAGGTDEVVGMGLRGSKILIVGGVGESVPGGGIDTWILRAYDANKSGALLWESTYANPDGEVTMGGIAVHGSRAIVAGSREVAGGHHRFLVHVYETKGGTLAWDDEIDLGTDDGRARATFIKGKKAWVVGSRTDAGTSKTSWWIRAYDAKAGVSTFEDVPAGETDDPRGATHLFLQGSTLVVAGVGEDDGGTTDWRVRAYKTKDHSLLWEDSYDSGFGDDEIAGLQGMGKRFMIGGTIAKSVGTQMRLLAIETKTGEFLWEQFVDEGTSNIVGDVAGHGPCLFLGGEIDGDYFIRGYTTITGVPMWDDRVDSGGFDAVFDMATFGSKTIFAAGTRDDGLGSGDRFIKNYDFHTGSLVWEDVQDIDGDDAIVGVATKGKNVFTISDVDRGGSDQDWNVTTHVRQ